MTSPSSAEDLVAGCTAATLLARRGWRVALFEKDRHPRFHIGESLVPMNLPILERLGVLDAVHRIGVVKRGADFPAPTLEGYNVFHFDRALGDSGAHAYQVRRDEFDTLLFDHAVTHGVEALEGLLVRKGRHGQRTEEQKHPGRAHPTHYAGEIGAGAPSRAPETPAAGGLDPPPRRRGNPR